MLTKTLLKFMDNQEKDNIFLRHVTIQAKRLKNNIQTEII